MSKRIGGVGAPNGLEPAAAATKDYVLEVDSPDASTTETEKLSIEDLVGLSNAVEQGSKTSVTISAASGTVVTNVGQSLVTGKNTYVTSVFDYDGSGGTNVVFGFGISGSFTIGQPLNCSVNGVHRDCRLTAANPYKFTIYDTLSTGATNNISVFGTLI